MPDPLDPGRDEHAAEKLRRYDEDMARYRETEGLHDPWVISQCGLCNDEGYRGNRVCDHVDHFTQNAGGRAEAKLVLEQIAARRRA